MLRAERRAVSTALGARYTREQYAKSNLPKSSASSWSRQIRRSVHIRAVQLQLPAKSARARFPRGSPRHQGQRTTRVSEGALWGQAQMGRMCEGLQRTYAEVLKVIYLERGLDLKVEMRCITQLHRECRAKSHVGQRALSPPLGQGLAPEGRSGEGFRHRAAEGGSVGLQDGGHRPHHFPASATWSKHVRVMLPLDLKNVRAQARRNAQILCHHTGSLEHTPNALGYLARHWHMSTFVMFGLHLHPCKSENNFFPQRQWLQGTILEADPAWHMNGGTINRGQDRCVRAGPLERGIPDPVDHASDQRPCNSSCTDP